MPQQVKHALGAAAVQLGDAALAANQRQRVRAKVELVVQGDEHARAKGAQRPRQSGRVDLPVKEEDGAADGAEDEQTAAPFSGASVGARGAWGAEGGGRGWAAEGLEGTPCGVDRSNDGGLGGGSSRGRCLCPQKRAWLCDNELFGFYCGRVPVKASGYVWAEHSRIV